MCLPLHTVCPLILVGLVICRRCITILNSYLRTKAGVYGKIFLDQWCADMWHTFKNKLTCTVFGSL